MVVENNEKVKPSEKKSLESGLLNNPFNFMQKKYCKKRLIEESDGTEDQCINLIESSAVNPFEKYGECDHYPIHCAANSGRADYLQALLKKNPGIVKQLDSNGRTALHIVIQSIDEKNYKTSFKAIETLINYNADINCHHLPELDTINYNADINYNYHSLQELDIINCNADINGHHFPEVDIINNNADINCHHLPKVDSPLNLIICLPSKIRDVIKEEWQAMLKFIDEKVDLIDLNLLQHADVQVILKSCLLDLWKNCNDYKFPYKLDIKGNSKDCLNDKKKFLRTLYSLSKDPNLDEYFQNMIKDRHLLSSVFRNTEFTDIDVQKTLAIGKESFTKETFYMILKDGSMKNKTKLKQLLDIWKERDYGTFKNPLLHKTNWSSSEYEILLNHSAIDLNMLDEKGDSALCYHIGKGNKWEIEALLKKNAFIGSLEVNKELTAMDIIDAEMLEEHLDNCIKMKIEKGKNYGKFIHYNYKCFKPPIENRTTINELTAINCIASNKKLQHLIQHPLITSFLLLKWNLLCPIFYLNLFIYSINFIMLTTYMTCFYAQKDASDRFAWMPFIFALIILIREVFQLTFLSFKRYFFSLSNYIELVLIASTFYISFHDFDLDSNRRAVGALVILLAAMELMILFATIPIFSLSLYMRMLKKVTVTFFHAFFLYSAIFMAFASSFYTLFGLYGEQEQDKSTDSNDSLKITNPAFAVLKTIVMFTGEFDASDLNFEFSNWIGYFIFVMFIFFIAIIMMNLLSGLAVSDTQQIISDARLDDCIVRAKRLEMFEKKLITNKTIDDLTPDELKSHFVVIKIHQSANLIDSQSNTQHIADHLNGVNLRTAENTKIVVEPDEAETVGQLNVIVRLWKYLLELLISWLKAWFEQRAKSFLTNFSIDEFDIVKNSMPIVNKYIEETSKKNNLDKSTASENQSNEVPIKMTENNQRKVK